VGGPEHGIGLVAERLTRIIGRRHVLRDVSFRAGAGEVVAIVGRNGAGKSTLLSLLSGRQSPDRGGVRVESDGRVLSPRESATVVGFLPHDLFLYPDLTARENLAFFASLYGVRHADERIPLAIDAIGLPRDADRPVRTLSRGMQQRAAIGRLMVIGARVWLLDEPTTGLDEPGRAWLAATLDAAARRGVLVATASHYRAEVEAATRVLVLDAGRLVLDVAGGADGATRAFEVIEGGIVAARGGAA